MPLGKTETISSMAGPKQVTAYDPSFMRIIDGEIGFFKKLNKDAGDLLNYQEQEYWEDKLKMAEQKKKDYLESPEFREKMNKIMKAERGTSWYSPQFGQQTDTPLMDETIEGGKRGTATYTSPYTKGGFGTFPKTDSQTKSASAKVKKATVKTPMNPYGFASGTEYDISKDLTERKMKTLKALKEDPFLYGNDGVKEALERGYLTPEMADLYYKEGEDAARKAMGLGKNPLAWEDSVPNSQADPEFPEIPNSAKTQLADPNGLSVRTKNFLENNVKTIEDLMELTEAKVRESRNTSKDTWSEIQKFKEQITKELAPKNKKSLSGVFKGLGRATAAGLAEAPAFEFLSPPSAGPSDPEDPVNQFERGQMSSEDFAEYIKQTAGARKKTNYFDPLQSIIRGIQGK